LPSDVPPNMALYATANLFAFGEHDAAWEVAKTHESDLMNGEEQLYAAAALTFLRALHDDSRWVTLRGYLTKPPREHPDENLVASYLAGLTDEDSYVRAVTTDQDRCTANYFIALKHAAAGDYDHALPRLMAAAFGPPKYPPQYWAQALLWKWTNGHATWHQIVAKRSL